MGIGKGSTFLMSYYGDKRRCRRAEDLKRDERFYFS